MPVAERLQRDHGLEHIKWIIPDAPRMKVTANMSEEMPACFGEAKEDEAEIVKTVQKLNQLITAEVDAGILPSRIVIGGFSQGAAMSLLTGLTNERKLGGIVVLSGRLPLPYTFQGMVSKHAKEVPIFFGHDTTDILVKLKHCTDSIKFIKNVIGIPEASPNKLREGGITLHTYEGLIQMVDDEELRDLGKWLKIVEPSSEDEL